MSTFALSPTPSTSEVSELKEQLLIAVQTNNSISFDCEKLEIINTPLLQLFLSLIKHHTNVSFQFLNVQEEVRTALGDFGCLAHFEGVLQCQN